jgi:predicted nucleic acid-binding protein
VLAYADTSFLIRIYTPHPDSHRTLAWMQRATQPLPFTPFHRHETRTGIRLRVYRKEITAEHRKAAFQEIEADLESEILRHTAVPWTDSFREADNLAALHGETLGVRSFDLLHVGMAVALTATDFLTFDERQSALAKAAGLKVKF